MHKPLSLLAAAAVLAAASPMPLHAAENPRSAEQLRSLFDAEWERGLREHPTRATYLGDHRFDDRWDDLSPQAIESQHAGDLAAMQALERIDPAQLSEGDRLNRELFRRQLQGDLDAYDYGRRFLAVSHQDALVTAHQMSELLVFTTASDYEPWLARMEALPVRIDQAIALLREGVKRGLVQPRVTMDRVRGLVAQQVVDDPTRSPFYGAFEKIPETVPAAERARLQEHARSAIATRVVPAYAKLLAYLDHEYLPHARQTVGAWDTPNGEQWYQNRVRWFTTTDLTADQIHELGLKEVARIRGEMTKVIARTGFKGSFEEFLAYLRSDPRFRYTDPDRLFEAYATMAKRIDPLLPQYFGKLPRMPYGVRPIPASIAPDTTTAYYQGPALDGRRAGFYYVNLYKPEERPTYEIPVLTIHEAVPGHHLQIALAQELGQLPAFRKDFEATAFVEGWALYSESLGEEMGLYQDPYDKFGQLTYEMWRAVRLVVDTGIHHKRWTRQQAIDYFKANAAKTELDIVNEVDRYIDWPGQAVAYKVGQLRILELRREAAAALGPRFDLRAFHDAVLANGALPLDVLSANVHRWLESARTAPAAAGR